MPGATDSPPSLLLALDTAGARTGIALYDGDVIAEAMWPSGRQGSQTLLPQVERLLCLANRSINQVTAVAVMRGPGSFSSLRVGLSTAKGLTLALGCALIAVPTLEVIAHAGQMTGATTWAVLDAGRARLTAAAYAQTAAGWQPFAGPFHGTAPQLAPRLAGPALVAGDILPALQQALADRTDLTLLPAALRARRASYLAELAWGRLLAGQIDDPVTLEPLYIHVGEATE